MRDRQYIYSMSALILVGIAAYLPAVLLSQNFIADSYCYLTLAEGLRSFSYSLPEFRHLKYLPFYPALISLLNFPGAGREVYLISAKLISMFSLIGVSLLVFDFLFGELRSLRLAFLAGLLALLCPNFILTSGNILSEPLFSLLGFACFFALARNRNYLAWILAGLAALTRWEGLLLVPALALREGKTPRRLLKGLLLGVLIYSPWGWFVLSHRSEFFTYSYPQELMIPSHTGLFFLLDVLLFLSPLLALLGAAGLGFFPKRLRPGVILYLAAYTGVHIFWHWRAMRFTLPLVPFFISGLFFLFAGLRKKWEGGKFARERRASVAALVVTAVSVLGFDVYAYMRLARLPADARIEAAQKLAASDQAAVVIGDMDPVMARWWGLKRGFSWRELGTRKPYPWVAERYLKDGARYLFWSGSDRFSTDLFKEPGQKGYLSQPVPYEGRNYLLTFYPMYFLDQGRLIVFNLELRPAEGE